MSRRNPDEIRDSRWYERNNPMMTRCIERMHHAYRMSLRHRFGSRRNSKWLHACNKHVLQLNKFHNRSVQQ